MDARQNRILLICVGLLSTVALVGLAAALDEVKISLDQVPGPARAALVKYAGGAMFTKLEREKDDGVMVFEAAWSVNGVEYEASVLSDGTLLQTEETIPAASAPPGVRSAIGQHFPAGAVVVVEKKLIVVYELEAKINGIEKEIQVFPTGKVVDDHDDDSDEDDNDDNDD